MTHIRRRAVLVLLIVAAGAVTAWAQAKPASVAGKWTVVLELSIGTATPTLVIKQDGEKITGTYAGRYGTFPFEGKVKDRAIEFTFAMNAEGQQTTMSFRGEVASDGQTMKGDATIEGLGDATWSAKRESLHQ